jgi:putative membrane protein
MYWDHMNGSGWTMMIVWSLIWIGFLGVIARFAVQRTRTSSHGSPPKPSQPSASTARELLDERLARGEIDADEYERRRSALENHRPVGTVR